MLKPESVNIFGMVYKIEYVDKPSDVDIFKRESLYGQIDHWTRSIRVYNGGRAAVDLWQTIMHEILHGIAEILKLSSLNDDDNHDELHILALAIIDVFTRNGWLVLTEENDGVEKVQ